MSVQVTPTETAAVEETPAEPAARPGAWAAIDPAWFRACVQCGLCTASCPTYAELGIESAGPRGRIQLMQRVTAGELPLTREVQRHLDGCLACRGCESACPHGVEYGRLIQAFRQGIATLRDARLPTDNRFHRRLVRRDLTDANRARRRFGRGRWTRRTGIDQLLLGTGLWRLLPQRSRRLLTMLPQPPQSAARLPLILPPAGRRRACVALFTGCLADALFRQIHWATARVLQRNGCEVFVLRSQVCCGAFQLHCASRDDAAQLAAQNVALFNANQVDAVVTNTGTCGATLKGSAACGTETSAEELRRFAGKVRDISEFLDTLGIVPPTGEIRATVTYHEACGLAHGQQIREQPRKLLRTIPGLTLVELPEADLCCGGAATYSFTEPAMADRLCRRKLARILGTGADVVATCDVSCMLHIAREARLQGRPLRMLHPVELLDLSYRQESLGP